MEPKAVLGGTGEKVVDKGTPVLKADLCLILSNSCGFMGMVTSLNITFERKVTCIKSQITLR
jgi:hypothetical protein